MSQNQTSTSEFKAWGMPIIYLATASIVFAAFIPHFRANADYLKVHIAGYVGKLSLFAVLNIICSIFLFWSPAIQYALINFLLNFMILCTICIPTFPKDLAKNFAFVFFIWMLIFTGIAPINAADDGIMGSVSSSKCTQYYESVTKVTDYICKDGWITFTVFCCIITIGLTFLANLILLSVAFDPALQGEESSASTLDPYAANENGSSYQQPAVGASGNDNGDYSSYQNAEQGKAL